MAPSWPAGTEHLKVDTEPHYHTEWKVLPVPATTLAQWAASSDANYFEFPPKNPYLPPKDMQVTKDLDPSPPVYPAIPVPTTLIDAPAQRLYLWHDRMYGDPYVRLFFVVHTDRALIKDGADALVQA